MTLFKRKIKVAVAMSGGVDSSVAALLMKKQGYDVVGFFMRNWSEQLPEIKGCPWETDQKDAQMVAQQLRIPFYVLNFEKEYYAKVVQYMIDSYKNGLTPNPDIMCNQEIKFGIFLERMMKLGFAKIATGHYARVLNKDGRFWLGAGLAESKDQSYFLCRVTEQQLSKTLFPVGEMPKAEVRQLAEKNNLVTAKKKDSQGVCFIGQIKVSDYLKRKMKGTKGNIVDINSKAVLGKHVGLEFFTTGQRQGIEVGGTGPYYVVERKFSTGELFVTTDHDDPKLYRTEFLLTDVRWITHAPALPWSGSIRIRYQHALI
ncbi:MAG: tRNA 2-thiouridine(34) synthase MnmA, partial [Candidatus Komeilibacteria bacterium]|nr:tRNA 2-thiouridine(34) synthase MnmA [Candidatus Komeilibacteria bacterium]